MASNTPFDDKAFDKQVKDWEWQWVNKHDNAYPDVIQGNAIEQAKLLFAKYNSVIQQSY
jgi:alpha-N-acetylglucosaminidase